MRQTRWIWAVAVAALLGGCRREAANGAPTPTSAANPVPMPDVALHYDSRPIGAPLEGRPLITHLQIVDLDRDGLPDVVACDGLTNSVRWLRQAPRGVFTEETLGDTVPGPAHVEAVDLNGDGRLDLVVASMGVILPNNDQIGSVVVLENLGGNRFRNRVLVSGIARVTDVRAVDFQGDGRIDLVVGQFGYVTGEIRWMENLGDWQFRSHRLLDAAGTVNTPVADFDGDGKPDFAAVVAQDAEEVRLFANEGAGQFTGSVLWKSNNTGWGSSGLTVRDLNGDGRPDLIYTNGDGFDGQVSLPPWHGLQWLENLGGRRFQYRRIGDLPGCYGPAVVDLNGDGRPDIVTVSAFNNWLDPDAVAMMAWVNDGAGGFRPVPLAHAPTHLIAVAAGDLDGDGVPELVTGGFHVYPPWTEMSRIMLWKRR